MSWSPLVSTTLLTLLTLSAVAASACSIASSETTGETSGQAISAGAPEAFRKDGNNGTVSCDTFCNGPQWGETGTCLGSAMTNIPCDTAVGLLSNGIEQTCSCKLSAGSVFTKHGNNGTVSCDTYCGGAQWGETGTCFGSSLQSNASVTLGGASVSYDSDCSIKPGFLDNAAEMACICSARALRSSLPPPPPPAPPRAVL